MTLSYISGIKPNADFAERIKRLRAKIGLTQQSLADRLEVSFVTVNRWENAQTKPSKLYWGRLRELEMEISGRVPDAMAPPSPQAIPRLDFTGDPDVVKVLAEGERLSFGYLMNPTFGTEVSRIDPLPHQRAAVYGHMLLQRRLRFLLADDAGAGKTIMSGLYIREMLSRKLLRRVMIVAPAGLVGNWYREMQSLFNLPFRIVTGADTRSRNPFSDEAGNHIIVSIDTLCSPKVFARLQEPDIAPYELAIFDEAHKLSADQGRDLRIHKSDRYLLAEAIAGAQSSSERFRLNWSVHHLLLLTATPHMGKQYPYYALWRLLEPNLFSTMEAFADSPPELRQSRFIRRTKEEMVFLDGKPLYPKRISDTLAYELNQGKMSEQTLYDETTDYLRLVYNKAKLLNRGAARLAMSVFQRRLASSTYALLRSFQRRLQKLNALIDDIVGGQISTEQMLLMQARLHEDDLLETTTADEEGDEEHGESHEEAEDTILQGVTAASLVDLQTEKDQVFDLLKIAETVYERGHESKFERLREILVNDQFQGEKLIIFTEHRDTLEFLVKRLGGLGYMDQVAQIHGGMNYLQRDDEVNRFRKPIAQGGARFLVCTDAAGEGINLQFCWIMINYDIPWNPARLEQRMGRIHRYGQKHDPVVIINLVAPATREGKVLKVLLDKLETIRKELRSDKVFDCIGRIFEGVSIKEYMEYALVENAEEIVKKIEWTLTAEQVAAMQAKEKSLYGKGGDVAKELPQLRHDMEQEAYRRLLPGYVRQYFQQAAPLVDIDINGDINAVFSLKPRTLVAMDRLYPVLEIYPEKLRNRFSFVKPVEDKNAVWLHPGESVFERFRAMIGERFSDHGIRGAVFIDPAAEKPYLFHLALLSVVRKADSDFSDLAEEETLECRLVGIRQTEGADISLCPVEQLLLLKGAHGLPSIAQRLAVTACEEKELVRAYLVERMLREWTAERKNTMIARLPENEQFIIRGFEYREMELATARVKHSCKARSGNRKVIEALETVKRQQRELFANRDVALATARREPELVVPGEIKFVAHALVVPSTDPEDVKQHNIDVERHAMEVVRAFEESAGAKVIDVHTPELARLAGLPDNPGFDLLSIRPGNERRSIEVKGRASGGDIEVTTNEWARACNMGSLYWLYVVFHCAAPIPHLVRVQDPFANLLAKSKGSLLISQAQVLAAGMEQ